MAGALAHRFCRDYLEAAPSRGQLHRIIRPQQSSGKLIGPSKNVNFQITLAKAMQGMETTEHSSRVLFGTVLAKKRGGSESSSPGPEASLGVSCRSDPKFRQRPELRRNFPLLVRW